MHPPLQVTVWPGHVKFVPHVGLPDKVEQEAGDGHDGNADEVKLAW